MNEKNDIIMTMGKELIGNKVLSIRYMDETMYRDVWQNSLDENNRRFVPDEVFETLEDTKEVVDQIINCYQSKDGPFIYAVFRKEDEKNIGYVQLVKIDIGWEIGYHIAKAYNGFGYATESVRLFLDYLKQNHVLKEIYGIALADNKASIRVLEKNGFEFLFKGIDNYQGSPRKIVRYIKRLY